MSAAQQQVLLAHCRKTGTWLLADEVYERLYYEAGSALAPSFLDQAEPDDRLLVVHSFSKSFLMTGWRLGWLVAPADLVAPLGRLVEYNTSCAPVFVQRAGCAALQAAEQLVPPLVVQLRRGRDTLVDALRGLPGVQVSPPPGGMYVFLRLPGRGDDSLALAKRLVAEAGLGLAPGAAFGAEGEGWLRWCFATADTARLLDGVARLKAW